MSHTRRATKLCVVPDPERGRERRRAPRTPGVPEVVSDGGYVLPGPGGPHEALFRGVNRSTGTVYPETAEGAAEAGLSLHEGEPCYDVDVPGDPARPGAGLLERPELAPRAARVQEGL